MYSNVIYKMIVYFDKDIKRINHALKVLSYARIISELEQISDDEKQIIELTAVLHDIGIKEAEMKYNSSAGKYQEIEGPSIAKEILLDMGYKKSITERVCFIIGNHHSYKKIDNIDFQILIEADLLVNIFEENYNKRTINLLKKYFKTQSGRKLLNLMY